MRWIVALALILALVLGVGMWLAFQPYCTSFEHHGMRYCSQQEWGGKRVWQEPIERTP
jgi:hypothetical protein